VQQKDIGIGDAGSHHGRYLGVGIYRPEEPWTKMVAAQRSDEGSAAKPIDDQAIIVVVDSETGEIRSCGDLTGYCIGMNPWKTPLASNRMTPIDLTEHVKPPEASPDSDASKPKEPASR
jgi:hypothetical protein